MLNVTQIQKLNAAMQTGMALEAQKHNECTIFPFIESCSKQPEIHGQNRSEHIATNTLQRNRPKLQNTK